MAAIGVGPKRLATYCVLAALLLIAVGANFFLYNFKSHYVTSRPVDKAALYTGANLAVVRGYIGGQPDGKWKAFEEVLSRELVLPALTTTLEKIEALGVYLLTIIHPHEGAPSPSPEELSELEAFEEITAGRINLWPDAVSLLYVTAANASGIPSRLVRIHDPGRKLIHWLAESYVMEQDQWTAVDLRFRKFYIQGSEGEMISAAELFSAVVHRDLEGLEVALFEGGSVVYRPLSENAASDFYYFHEGTALEFPSRDQLSPSPFRRLGTYLYAPQKVYALQWQPFIRWGWVKLGLLSATGVLGLSVVCLLVRDLKR